MATPYQYQVSPTTLGLIHTSRKLTQESANAANRLLMENHENYHVYFDEAGLHNHIIHHILSIFALGASPSQIERAYKNNQGYQLPAVPLDADITQGLDSPVEFAKYLGDSRYYRDYGYFFKREIESKGVEAVVNEYLFKGDERANDMFARLYSGFLHPVIHLGYGLEFDQPITVAEALAQTAVHPDTTSKFLWGAEGVEIKSPRASKTLVQVFDEIKANPKLADAVRWSDPPDKVNGGLYHRGADEIINLSSQWTVQPENLKEKTAEMINAGLYMTALSQRSGKAIKFDFFFMHCANASYFFSVFDRVPWLSKAAKVRLVQSMGRLHLLMYAAARAPQLRPEDLHDYKPRRPGDWESIYARAAEYQDDGHTSKLIRAIAIGERLSHPFEGRLGFGVGGDDFLKMAHMVMDSCEAMDAPGWKMPDASTTGYKHAGELDPFIQRVVVRWLRWTGFDEAWEAVEERH